jgi:hypothetical protein
MKLVLTSILAATAGAASAQFGAYGPPVNPQQDKPTGLPPQHIILGAGLTSFAVTDTANPSGGLFTLDKQFLLHHDSGVAVTTFGAWYFSGGSKLWEFHARHTFTPQVGVQVGFLKTPGASKLTDWDAFVYYRPLERAVDHGPVRAVYATIGAGPYYFDAPGDRWQPTAFGQFDVRFADRLGMQASYWFIKSPVSSVDVNRVALTISYQF